jgi:hypothetical protein
LLKRGGPVRYYANGGDNGDDDNDQRPVRTAMLGDGTVIPQPPPAGGGASTSSSSQPPDLDTSALPRMGSPQAMADQPSPLQSRVWAAAPPQGEGQTPLTPTTTTGADLARVAGAETSPYYGAGMNGAGRPSGARTIPELTPPARTWAERLAVNPLWNAGIAMLGSRSPYFGVGLAGGMQAATGAIERGREEKLLDKKPQLIDDGKTLRFRVGDKLTAPIAPSPKARAGAGQTAAASRAAESQITQWSRLFQAALQNDPEWGPQSGKSDVERLDEADRLARDRWNRAHPDAPVPVQTGATAGGDERGTPGTAGPPGAAPPMTVTGTSGKPPAPTTEGGGGKTAALPSYLSQPYDYSKPYRPPQEIESSEDFKKLVPPPMPVQTRTGTIDPNAIRTEAEGWLLQGNKGLSKEYTATRKGNEDNLRVGKIIRNYGQALATAAGIEPKELAEMQSGRQYAMRYLLGPNGSTARAIGVAMRHLDTLQEAHDALQNGNIPLLNKIVNYFGLQAGQDPQAAFQALQQIVGAEIIKGVVGSQSGQAERETAARNLNMNWTPGQFAATRKRVEEALAGQLIGQFGQARDATVSEQQFRRLVGEPQFAKLTAVAKGGGGGGGGGQPGGGGGGWQRDPSTGYVRNGPNDVWRDPKTGKPVQ